MSITIIFLTLFTMTLIVCSLIYLNKDDDEFVERTEEAYDRVEENEDDFYSVDEFIEEIEKW